MRADRMISTLLLMQARERVTAREVADELEISVSTARRDLEALAMAGVPVYPQPGRRGGWSLVGGARTDLSGLTSSESRALFSLLGAAEGAAPETASAVRKLLRALPGPFRSDAQAAAAAIRRDPAGWGELTVEKPAVVEAVQQAIIDRVQLRLDYTGSAGVRRTVTISPLGLIVKGAHWYLVAARAGAEGTRTYRMDRAHAVAATTEPAQWPADFDLDREWQRISDYVESRRARVRATVRLPRRHLWVLRDHFGSYLDVLGDLDDDRVEVTVAAHTARSIAEQLAGWGATIEVLEPEPVRRELAGIGAELTASYGSPAAEG